MKAGFTLIELLVVVAIIGILAALILVGVQVARLKAYDNSIRSDMRQIRIEAEQVYDSQAGSYLNWGEHTTIAAQMATLLTDIDKQHGDTNEGSYLTVVRQSQRKEYCVSAPLRAQADKFYCVDATGVFSHVSSHCPDNPLNGDPLRCPSE